MSEQNKKPEEKIEISEIIDFYKTIHNLRHQYAIYLNTLVEIKIKAETDIKNLDENDKNNIKEQVNLLRYWCIQAHTSYVGLCDAFKIEPEEKIKEFYKEIKNNYLIPSEEAESFVQQLLKFQNNKIIKDLLKTNQEYVNQIYNV